MDEFVGIVCDGYHYDPHRTHPTASLGACYVGICDRTGTALVDRNGHGRVVMAYHANSRPLAPGDVVRLRPIDGLMMVAEILGHIP